MGGYLITPDGRRWVPSGSGPPAGGLQSIPNWPGVVTELGRDYGVTLQDHLMSDRDATIDMTNAIQVLRPIDPDGLMGLIMRLFGLRISPQGKIIVPLDKGNGPIYWQWFIDSMGSVEKAEKLRRDGNGFFDTASLWGFMCAATGGDLQRILGEINQNGTYYCEVEILDYYTKPVRDAQGNWWYKGETGTYETRPDWFVTRTSRRSSQDNRWITSGGVNNTSWANAGVEHWPKVGNARAALQRNKLLRYPELPNIMHVFAESLVVDGYLVDRSEYFDMLVDAIKFRGSATDIRNAQNGLWYRADEMLVRAQEPYAASAYDYRCWISQDDLRTPWMRNRGYRSPVPAW